MDNDSGESTEEDEVAGVGTDESELEWFLKLEWRMEATPTVLSQGNDARRLRDSTPCVMDSRILAWGPP